MKIIPPERTMPRPRLMILYAAFLAVWFEFSVPAQTLNLPARTTNAPTGSQWTNIVWMLSQDERENWIYAQIISGNIPSWQRTLKPIVTTAGGHTATYYVAPDEMAI